MGAEEQDQDPWHQEVRLIANCWWVQSPLPGRSANGKGGRMAPVAWTAFALDDRIAGEANVLVFQED
jgi:hypothetical protein